MQWLCIQKATLTHNATSEKKTIDFATKEAQADILLGGCGCLNLGLWAGGQVCRGMADAMEITR